MVSCTLRFWCLPHINFYGDHHYLIWLVNTRYFRFGNHQIVFIFGIHQIIMILVNTIVIIFSDHHIFSPDLSSPCFYHHLSGTAPHPGTRRSQHVSAAAAHRATSVVASPSVPQLGRLLSIEEKIALALNNSQVQVPVRAASNNADGSTRIPSSVGHLMAEEANLVDVPSSVFTTQDYDGNFENFRCTHAIKLGVPHVFTKKDGFQS